MILEKRNEMSLSQIAQLEDEFFSKEIVLSYSGLNRLLLSPKAFYRHYILRQKEDVVDKSMIEGKLLHLLLFNADQFDQDFVLMSSKLPSDNPKKVLDQLYQYLKSEYPDKSFDEITKNPDCGHFINETIISILKEVNLYQSLKTDTQRLEKILSPVHVSYLEYLFDCEKKIPIDQEVYQKCMNLVDSIKATSKLRALMGMDADSLDTTIEVYNETDFISFEIEESFGIRGIIDNLVVDHNAKVIRVNDLKKTSKSVKEFSDSIEYYKYWIQAALYKRLIDSVKTTTLKVDYPVEFRFIVVDQYEQVVSIKIGDETMEKWDKELDAVLKIANFHMEKRDFSLPYEFLQETEFTL